MKVAALLVAAGRGARAGAGAPKQFRRIAGRSVLERAVDAFRAHPDIGSILVAIHPDDVALYVDALGDTAPPYVFGGAERQETVRIGLEALVGASPEAVLIHDAARPFIPRDAIDRVIASLAEFDGACAAMPAVETMRREVDGGDGLLCGDLVDRSGLWRAQTPQGFRFAPLLEAHRQLKDETFTDDAEIASRAGLRVSLVEGAPENVKLTTPADFAWAEKWARVEDGADTPMMETRTGQGFDVHAFGQNADGSSDHAMLCGVRVPHEQGLKGHSDADVGLHALTDALYGAISAGDIGAHFPPSDDAWKGAASDQFLRHAAEMVRETGGRITQLDVTLICERPKIGPHVAAMRAQIAEIAGVAVDRVSVKATTSERLGFTGRKEGIAALAQATVETPRKP